MKILKASPKYFELTTSLAANQAMYLMLNLNTRCCYACPKCALPGCGRSMGAPLSESERKNIIRIAAQAGTKALVIVGAGEPTDKKSFPLVKPIIEQAAAKGLSTILFTTLYGLTRQQAQIFRDHNVSLYISLDSLEPRTYRKLTGHGKIERILRNISMLRQMFRPESVGQHTVVRLGINTTVVKQNETELEAIREFAGDDIHYVANFPIRRGKFAQHETWNELVGDAYEQLVERSHQVSETGSHSSINEGVCSYFFRGVSVDTDGKLLSCGYAGETACLLPHVSSLHSAEEYLRHYARAQSVFRQFVTEIGYRPSCPLRDEHYLRFVNKFGNSPFRIL